MQQAAGAATAIALLAWAAPASAQLGELAAYSDRLGCVAGREFNAGKPGNPTVANCAGMTRQRNVAGLVGSPDGARLYAVDVDAESVVAYRAVAAGLRELTGAGSCAPLSGARTECRFGEGVDDRSGGVAAISPDGRFLYVGSVVGGPSLGGAPDGPRTFMIDVFRTGDGVERVGCLSSDGTDGRGATICDRVRGMSGMAKLAVSLDGRSLYALSTGGYADPETAAPDEGIAVFERDPDSGVLRQLDGPAGCITRGGAAGECAAEPSFEGLADLVVGPAGLAAYAASFGGSGARGGIFTLRRDPAGGALEVARGPGTCIGGVPARADCAPDTDMEDTSWLSASPDGRFVHASGLNAMMLVQADEAAATIAVRGCVSNGYPKKCMRTLTDPAAGGRLSFTRDGRAALLHNGDTIETLARDRSTGAVTSRGCFGYDYEEESICASSVVSMGTEQVVVAPRGDVVYAGGGNTIYTLAPGAAITPPLTVRLAGGVIPVRVRCEAGRTCRGTMELEGYEEDFTIRGVPLAVASGRTRTVRVRVSAAIQRAITRRRRVTVFAKTRIGASEGRALLSEREIRVDASRPPARPTCRRGGVRTLLRTGRLRVYTVRTPIRPYVSETTYACLFSAGRQVRLDEPDLWEASDPFTPVGRLLAYEYELAAEGPTDATTYVRVVDLRSGRERRAFCAWGPGGCGADGSSGDVRRLVMLPSGGVAWTIESGSFYAVVKADAGRAPRLLDESDRVRPSSLRLNGNRLTWKRGDRTRSATLR